MYNKKYAWDDSTHIVISAFWNFPFAVSSHVYIRFFFHAEAWSFYATMLHFSLEFLLVLKRLSLCDKPYSLKMKRKMDLNINFANWNIVCEFKIILEGIKNSFHKFYCWWKTKAKTFEEENKLFTLMLL